VKSWYCVLAEFLDSKEVPPRAKIVKIKPYGNKPNNQYRQVHGMTAFIFWLSSENAAKELCKGVNSGELYVDDLLSFYHDCLPLEGRAA